ncbi:MAG: hypothetical protein WBE30_11795 [Candidatus Cybelea sp.]
MTWQHLSVGAGEQTKTLIQSLGDLPRRKHLHSRCSQFDRQRDAVEPAADLGHGIVAIVD